MNSEPISRKARILGGLWGAVVGDALGVPVEFMNREELQANPVTGMRGHGTHHQEAGTWSDDSSLLICTVDSLVNHEFDTEDMGKRFRDWFEHGFWAAHGVVFDVGMTTSDALLGIRNGIPAEEAGRSDEHSNGNGSLMRIIPVVFRFAETPLSKFLDRISRASGITHGHQRSRMACGYYALMVKELLSGAPPATAFGMSRNTFSKTFAGHPELKHFTQIPEDLLNKPENWIVSTGYVIHTLTASLWCLLTTDNYRECVLKAVNLGGDTDTTGCVAGGLAGVAYGIGALPHEWIQQLARHPELDQLFNKFSKLCER